MPPVPLHLDSGFGQVVSGMPAGVIGRIAAIERSICELKAANVVTCGVTKFAYRCHFVVRSRLIPPSELETRVSSLYAAAALAKSRSLVMVILFPLATAAYFRRQRRLSPQRFE